MNPLLLWISENLTRLFEKSPKFFQVWQVISSLVFAVSGLPLLLHEMKIDLPDELQALTDKTVAYCAVIAFVFSRLSVRGNIQEVKADGTILKSTPQKLPFTKLAEEKQLIKESTEPEQFNPSE